MGYFFASLSGIAAGTAVVTGKLGVLNISSVAFSCYSSLIGAASTLIYLLATKRLAFEIPKKTITPLLGQIFFSYLAMWTFWEGARTVNAAVGSFLVRIETVFILILSVIFLGERLRRREIIAALIILSGAFVIAEAEPGKIFVSLKTGEASGIALILISALAFAMTEFFSKKIAANITPFNLVLIRNTALGFIFGITGLFLDSLETPAADTYGIIVASAISGPILARLLFMNALRRTDLGKASLFGQIEPFFAALLSFFVLGDVPNVSQWIGGILIIAGCALMVILPKAFASKQE